MIGSVGKGTGGTNAQQFDMRAASMSTTALS